MAGYRWPRGTYDLPELLDPSCQRYRVTAGRVRLFVKEGEAALIDSVARQAVPVPPDRLLMTQWVLAREAFVRQSFDKAFALEPVPKREQFLKDLENMALLQLER